MLAEELETLLAQLRVGVAQPKIALRCDCDNLETVYVHVADDGGVWVTDDHRTFQYLATANDSIYISLSQVDMESVRQVCKDLGVSVFEAPADGYPGIGCRVCQQERIDLVVAQVAEAIESVFRLLQKPSLAEGSSWNERQH